MVIDVETITCLGTDENHTRLPNAPYNVGVTIGRGENIISQHQLGIKEFWEFPEKHAILYYRDKFKVNEFDTMFNTVENFVVNWLIPKIEMYGGPSNVRLWSFNSPFDKRSIVYTLRQKNEHKIARYIESLQWLCLWEYSSSILKDSKKFINWLIDNEAEQRNNKFISDKGNFRTNAEIVYGYITKDPYFKEVHKGMQDTAIEFAILNWCKKSSIVSMKEGTKRKGGNWQIVNRKSGWLFKTDKIAKRNIAKVEELISQNGDEITANSR